MIKFLSEGFSNLYHSCLDSMEILSYDDQNKQSLCHSDHRMYNYDKIIKMIYRNENAIASPDALHFKDDKIIFIEFKNGEIKSTGKKLG